VSAPLAPLLTPALLRSLALPRAHMIHGHWGGTGPCTDVNRELAVQPERGTLVGTLLNMEVIGVLFFYPREFDCVFT